jgi:NAD(P)-dependent dehydrogenase (short-subunit alcohol dehydrogenase family)
MKVVVITGGSSGIGKAMAIKFAQTCYKVVICSKSKTELDAAQKEIGPNCVSTFCDVRFLDHVDSLFDFVLKEFGRIDVLINCAGILGPMGRFEDNDLGEWRDAIDVNLIGTVNCVYRVIPIMKEQQYGRIITMCGGGVGADDLPKGFSAYTTSKFAIAGFTELIGDELNYFNIFINAISPGAIDTQMAKKRWVQGETPERPVKLAYFLATTDLKINGKVISAKWDDYEHFEDKKGLYNLRRVSD